MDEYRFTLTGDLTQVEAVQAEIKQVLQGAGVRLKQIQGILLAVGEWLERLIRHGQPSRIDILLNLDDTEVRLRVSDDGQPMAVDDLPPGDPAMPLAGEEPSLIAMHLIRSLMDEVDCRRTGDGNVLEMSKRILSHS